MKEEGFKDLSKIYAFLKFSLRILADILSSALQICTAVSKITFEMVLVSQSPMMEIGETIAAEMASVTVPLATPRAR